MVANRGRYRTRDKNSEGTGRGSSPASVTSPRTTRKPPPLRAEPRGHGAFRAVDSRSRPAKRIVRNAPIVYLTACGAACRKNKNQRDSQLFVKLAYHPQCIRERTGLTHILAKFVFCCCFRWPVQLRGIAERNQVMTRKNICVHQYHVYQDE